MDEHFSIEATYGIRTFWHLQQNQRDHKNSKWQEEVMALEKRVSHIESFKAIASFHHVLLRKK